jgi:hypothetical protein
MHTSARELSAEHWGDYFKAMKSGGERRLAVVEVAREPHGDRRDVASWPLQSISYDPTDDLVMVVLDGHQAHNQFVLRHLIADPQTISVYESGPFSPTMILIQDASGAQTLIRLHAPRSKPKLETRTARGRSASCVACSRAKRHPLRHVRRTHRARLSRCDCGFSPTISRRVCG